MSEGTKIQWADDTWNPWRGCTKVSLGCAHCYAETLVTTRLGGKWGKGAPRQRLKDFAAPLRWNKVACVCNECGETMPVWGSICIGNDMACTCEERHRRRVFSLSLGDWLDEEVPVEWLADMLKVIHDCPNLDFLLLTKRPESWKPRLEAVKDSQETADEDSLLHLAENWLLGVPVANVWLGVSVENQETADRRIPELLRIPARVRFLSVEPMLGPVDVTKYLTGSLPYKPNYSQTVYKSIDWVIFGGESGKGARPCCLDWIRDGVAQCRAAGVAPFVKQLGSDPLGEPPWRTLTLNHPKGGDMAEWPEDLRVREFPTTDYGRLTTD